MNISLPEAVAPLLIVGLRVSMVVLFAPLFGSVAIPVRVKAVLVLAITAVLYPALPHTDTGASLPQWGLIAGRELILGISIGIVTNLVFDAVQAAGQVLSVQMGYSLVNILDPQTQVDTTVVAVFHQTIAMLIFLRLDVHHWILRALAKSFQYTPYGALTIGRSFVTQLLQSAGTVLAVGIQIAAPVLTATIVADVALGLLGKASSTMPIMLLGPAVKSLLGLAILASTLTFWPTLFERYFGESVALTEHLLRAVH